MIKGRKGVVIAVIAAAAALGLLTLILVFLIGPGAGEPPVIYGVRETITLYTDDDILAALTDGVYAADPEGDTFPVEIAVYDESGELVAEYNESTGNVTKYQAGTYRAVYRCKSAEEAECVLTLHPEDKEPPVITGARDLTVTVGETVSYRDGVTVTDNMDENVQLQIDAGQVNLEQPGTYPVTYWAEDSRGNRAEVTVTVLVEEPPVVLPSFEPTEDQKSLDEMAADILSRIITPGMTQRQQARAIFDYIISNMRYVGTTNNVDWVTAARVGFTQKRGDCYYYFACSKELLTMAGIPNIDLHRVGGNSDHYWQLVNVGDGWYHFDTCPHPGGYPLTAFLLTEAEVREYSSQFTGIWLNYYMYDYDACPVTVEGTPEDETPEPEPSELPEEEPSEEVPLEEEPSEEVPPEVD